MPAPLLTTKLYLPSPRPGQVTRSRLLDRLDEGLLLDRSLTVASAPAGYGKTTLISGWISSKDKGERIKDKEKETFSLIPYPLSFAWLSLDESDNDPARFWTYLVHALQTCHPGVGQALLALLHSPQPAVVQELLADLINDVAALPGKSVLVLDDYHVITDLVVHESLAFFVEHLPRSLHLVISTRSDPPLPLARMRARGQLTEVRAADLQFTPTEAGAWLGDGLGLDLRPEDVSRLGARTEGWAAGLQMAGLALRSLLAAQPAAGADPAGQRRVVEDFIAAFSGKHHFVLDYLAQEVLNRQTEEVREFLLCTSVLNRLTASLCDELLKDEGGSRQKHPGPTGRKDEEKNFSPHPSSFILEFLERSNLFLIPLDETRTWFRYHHLFADLLRAHLSQTHPDWVARLHSRAAAWFEAQGLVEEAVWHAMQAQDWERAARLVEDNVQDYLFRGQMATVIGWIRGLPAHLSRARPRLSLQQAWGMAIANRIQEVEPFLVEAEQALEAGSMDLEASRPIRAQIALLRAVSALLTGRPDRVIELAVPARELLSAEEQFELSILEWGTGFAYRMLGDLGQAVHSFEEAVRVGKAAGNVWYAMVALSDLAITYRIRGQLYRAIELFQETLRFAAEQGIRQHGYLSRVDSGLSAVYLEQNRVEEALQSARAGVEKTRHWQSSNHVTWAYIFLGSALQAAGDLAGAGEAYRQADLARRSAPVLPVINGLWDACQVRLWLAEGNLAAAARWVEGFWAGFPEGVDGIGRIDETLECRLVALARVWIARASAEGKTGPGVAALENALRVLEILEANAREIGRENARIEILTLQAVACYWQAVRLGETESRGRALEALEKALQLGWLEGYRRVFLNEGKPIEELLHNLRSSGLSKTSPEYLESLLSGFSNRVERVPGANAGLVEPLTERELEVARLLAAGLSNREMAQRLFVSEGTVKTHAHNLYGKLGVETRTQAVARLRELHLLD